MSTGTHRDERSVLIVDDRLVVAQSLAAVLGDHGLHAEVLPEPLLADGMPPPSSARSAAVVASDLGTAAAPIVRQLCDAGWRVVALVDPENGLRIGEMLEAGVIGWVSVGSDLVELAGALDAVFAGVEDLVDPNDRTARMQELRRHRTTSARRLEPFERLTPRERSVLAGLIEGLRADDMAASSFVSVTTVRNQIQSVLTKLDVRSQLEAVAAARKAGWAPDRFDVFAS